MDILFFLAVAAVLAILWFRGNLFACVFLSLPVGTGGVFGIFLASAANTASDRTFGAWMIVASAVALAAIWLPRYYQLYRGI
jgi:hypothetical protein